MCRLPTSRPLGRRGTPYRYLLFRLPCFVPFYENAAFFLTIQLLASTKNVGCVCFICVHPPCGRCDSTRARLPFSHTATLPSYLWTLRIFPPLSGGSRLRISIAKQVQQSYTYHTSSTDGLILLTHILTFSRFAFCYGGGTRTKEIILPVENRTILYSRISEVIHYDSARATVSGFLQYTSDDR